MHGITHIPGHAGAAGRTRWPKVPLGCGHEQAAKDDGLLTGRARADQPIMLCRQRRHASTAQTRSGAVVAWLPAGWHVAEEDRVRRRRGAGHGGRTCGRHGYHCRRIRLYRPGR